MQLFTELFNDPMLVFVTPIVLGLMVGGWLILTIR